MKKLTVISYRCPTSHGAPSFELSTGGLVAGLYSLKNKFEIDWYCFDNISATESHNNLTIHRVAINKELNDRYYGKFCNSYIWPLFHYISTVDSFESSNWNSYIEANKLMANAVSSNTQPEQLILVNDYHFTLLPKYLREKGFNNISFFWHIPWIKYEYISRIPNLKEIVSGIIDAKVIGFHTENYKKNFEETLKILNIKASTGKPQLRSVPIGLNTQAYSTDSRKLEESKFNRELAEIKQKNIRIIGSISRLDMTKGIVQSINAFRRLLESHNELLGKIVYVMVISPSRTTIQEYADLKKKVDQMVGNVNSAFRTVSWSPILYIYRRISQADLISLMRNSDLFLVTPVMDGLNLVAEEYVLLNDSGIPIISKFAGISEYLNETPIVNPFDPDELAEVIYKEILEDKRTIAEINRILKKKVKELDINNWVSKMLLNT